MDCRFCEWVHILGPYALVVLFAIVLMRFVKRHNEQLGQLHTRTIDVFERQNATYERVHFDLVALKKDEPKAPVDGHKKG